METRKILITAINIAKELKKIDTVRISDGCKRGHTI